ncbi:hypothetical protein GF322_01330 [Candidatus Dependentiae bacterium]|nr:hypothetical protein [Candidatus Dependentiae bacterium]
MKKNIIKKTNAILLYSIFFLHINIYANTEEALSYTSETIQPGEEISNINENNINEPNVGEIINIDDETNQIDETNNTAKHTEPTTIVNNNENVKNSALKLSQAACFFNTNGDDPFLIVLDPSIRETKIIKCGCFDSNTQVPRQIKTENDLKNLIPLRLTINGFGGNYKYDIKYPGERKSMVGSLLASTILPDIKYKGALFIDEYNAGIPMFWVLKNINELRSLIKYFNKNLEQNPMPKQKNILVLKFLNDPNLETLTEMDKQFLNKYFELFPLTDKDLKNFFENRNNMLIDTNFNMGNSKPKRIGESILQGIFRQAESFYEDFEAKKIAILIGAFIAITFIHDTIKDETKKINQYRKNGFKKLFGDETITGAFANFINYLKNTFSSL